MTNQVFDVYEMFVNATSAYIQTLRKIKEMDMIHSISFGGLIHQLHDEMYEVESELLNEIMKRKMRRSWTTRTS